MKNYEPPFAKDISTQFAKGQVTPMGVCKSGGLPYYNCVAGPGIQPTCVGTGLTPDVSACGGGFYHTEPACRVGVVAATVCGSGQGQQ
jgi:hypothetical protein